MSEETTEKNPIEMYCANPNKCDRNGKCIDGGSGTVFICPLLVIHKRDER